MAKTIILLPKKDNPTTGGQIYDQYFAKNLLRLDRANSVLCDDDFSFKPPLSILFNITYILSIRKFTQYTTLITNSRLYPRMFLFILILKLIKPRLKLFCIHHHYNFMSKSGLSKRIHKTIEIKFLNFFDVVIVPSEYVRDIGRQYLSKPRTSHLEIGFNKKTVCPKTFYLEKPKLLYVGTIEPRKGLHLLLEALKDLTPKYDYDLEIVGKFDAQNSYFKSLKKLILNYGLEEKINFSGRVSEQELEKHYQNASIFVFPSLHEGYGMVIIEAMSYGLPVVAFNNSAISYRIQNGRNGLLAENENVEDFRKQLSTLFEDSSLVKKLGQNAFKTFESARSLDSLKQDIETFYSELNEN